MKKTIVSAYFPTENPTNKYTENAQRCIKNAGIEVLHLTKYIHPFKDFLRCKIFNFNWIEDCMSINTSTKLKERLKYIRMLLFFDALKLLGKKIVWTMHNKLPHGTEKREYKVKLMKKLSRCADAVVIHSFDSVEALKQLNPHIDEKKVHLINHPNYISDCENTKNEDLRTQFGFGKEDTVFLFIGQIRAYKNVEVLISAFASLNLPECKLLIAGGCKKEYADELYTLIGENKNIVLSPSFVPDEKMNLFYRTSDVVVLPYDKDSSLNSGAAYLSFSHKKTVICPDIGTMNQLKDKSFSYMYSYADKTEHLARLTEAIKKVFSDLQADKDSVRRKGEEAYRYMLTEHSDASISESYKKLYQSLVGRKGE